MRTATIRRVLAASVAIVVGAALAGCSPGDSTIGSKTQITFWNGWTGGAAPKLVPKLISQFNASHKNIQVSDVPMQWTDIAKKMPLAIKAGKGPDVAVLHGDDLATYTAENLLVSNDSIVKRLGYSASDFPPGVYKKGSRDGKQYAIPWSVTPLGLFVNTTVQSQAGISTVPTDRASYDRALESLKQAGVKGEWVDGYEFTGTYQFESLLWQFGGELYNKDATKATFDSAAGVKALTWMADHVSKGYSPANVSQDGDINALIAGKTAYNWNGVWQTTNSALTGVRWKAAPVPQIGSEKAVWSSSTHWVFPANKGQDRQKTAAAATFVKWMNDHSSAWAATGELPADNTVRNAPSLVKKYPDVQAFIDELPYAHYETASPGITDANAYITTALSDALAGKQSPQKALEFAAQQADQILALNRTKYGE